jgi:5'-3' exonuclease
MDVHLVDGTYELFRHFYALPSHVNDAGEEVAAVRGVVASVLAMLEDGATHVGVATDATVDSFRNGMYDGYKTGEDMDPDLWAQFPLLDAALEALGVTVWPMVEQEADDGLAAAAHVARRTKSVERVYICTPDKDLAQCVDGDRVVQFDRRKNVVFNADGVFEKFGVRPASIPDYLGLMGDSADGFPGLPGWGAKSAALVLAEYDHLEMIPNRHDEWAVPVRGAEKLATTLREQWETALLFRDIATVRTDHPVGTVASWRYQGPTSDFETWVERLDAPRLSSRMQALRS